MYYDGRDSASNSETIKSTKLKPTRSNSNVKSSIELSNLNLANRPNPPNKRKNLTENDTNILKRAKIDNNKFNTNRYMASIDMTFFTKKVQIEKPQKQKADGAIRTSDCQIKISKIMKRNIENIDHDLPLDSSCKSVICKNKIEFNNNTENENKHKEIVNEHQTTDIQHLTQNIQSQNTQPGNQYTKKAEKKHEEYSTYIVEIRNGNYIKILENLTPKKLGKESKEYHHDWGPERSANIFIDVLKSFFGWSIKSKRTKNKADKRNS